MSCNFMSGIFSQPVYVLYMPCRAISTAHVQYTHSFPLIRRPHDKVLSGETLRHVGLQQNIEHACFLDRNLLLAIRHEKRRRRGAGYPEWIALWPFVKPRRLPRILYTQMSKPSRGFSVTMLLCLPRLVAVCGFFIFIREIYLQLRSTVYG